MKNDPRTSPDSEIATVPSQDIDETYFRIFDNIGISLIHHDLNGVFLSVNRVAANSMGREPEELVGMRLDDIFSKEVSQRMLDRGTHIAATERDVEYEDMLELPGGTKWFWSRLHPLYDKDGSVVAIQVIAHDITDRKKAEDALRQREELLRTIVSAVNESIICIDDFGRVTLLNPAAEKMFGIKREEILNQPLDRLMPKEYRRQHAQDVRSFFASGKPNRAIGKLIEVPGCHEDGTIFPMDISLSTGEIGDQKFVVSICRDISARKQTEAQEKLLRERLERAERMESLGLLAGGIAHDLNNVLGPILILPQIIDRRVKRMRKDYPDECQKIANDLSMITSSAERGASVIRDLLALSRRESYVKNLLELNQVIRHCIETLDAQSGNLTLSDVRIDLKLDKDLWPISGSESHLARALENLIRNSVEAMTDHTDDRKRNAKDLIVCSYNKEIISPHVGHETILPGKYVVVSLSDTGIGIDPEDLQRVFEPFFSRKREQGHLGSGLGLSIVHGIVKDHDGFIDLETRAGEGTTVEIYIPAHDETETLNHRAASPQHREQKILVVDDEIGQRYLVKSALNELGYSVTTASSGREAIALFQQSRENGSAAPFDLVILDMIMDEDLDGLATFEQIRGIYREQRVVITSGYAATHRVKLALKKGASWLSKPYDLNKLTQAVQENLTRFT